jgi:hypothetical protein
MHARSLFATSCGGRWHIDPAGGGIDVARAPAGPPPPALSLPLAPPPEAVMPPSPPPKAATPKPDIVKGARQEEEGRREQETRASPCTCTAVGLRSFEPSQKFDPIHAVHPDHGRWGEMEFTHTGHERCRFRSQNACFSLAVGAAALYGLRFMEIFARCRTALRLVLEIFGGTDSARKVITFWLRRQWL